MRDNILRVILRSKKTVFSFKELLMSLPSMDIKTLKSKINYYTKTGEIYHIRRGLYSKDKNYDHYELATKILIPSYISFETVLKNSGIIFQHYEQIFVASYQSRSIICDGQEYNFKTIKSLMLTNITGIEIKENYSIASPERAFLDVIYLNKDYYFDNLAPLNWDKVYEILTIYENKRMEKMVKMYHKSFLKDFYGSEFNNYNKSLIESLKKPKEAIAYLNAALEECKDGTQESQQVLLMALRNVALAQEGETFAAFANLLTEE